MRGLDGLDPEWISPPGRFGLALSFVCPRCRNHRLNVWFDLPLDGAPQLESGGEVRLYRRNPRTSGMGDITILEALEFGDCFSGMLIDGELLLH